MKIKDVEIVKLSCFFEKKWEFSGGSFPGWHAVLVKIVTDTGLEGIGEIGSGVQVPQVVDSILEEFKRIPIGKNVEDINKIVELLYQNSLYWGRAGVTISVISGIDIALHDVLGKFLNVPVYTLLGGRRREKIKAYASGGVVGERSLETLQNELKEYVELGYKAVKIRIGYGLKKDIEITKAAREAIGGDVDLLLDAGQNYAREPWDLPTAMKIVKALEPFNPFWLEEPMRTDRVKDYAKLTSYSNIPIAGGENATWRYEFYNFIENHALDIINPDCVQAGGIRETKRICEFAELNGVAVAPHIWGSAPGLMANLHLIASTSNCILFEYSQMENPLRSELLMEELKFEDGFITIPEAPGLGVKLTDEILAKYPFNSNALPPSATFNR